MFLFSSPEWLDGFTFSSRKLPCTVRFIIQLSFVFIYYFILLLTNIIIVFCDIVHKHIKISVKKLVTKVFIGVWVCAFIM